MLPAALFAFAMVAANLHSPAPTWQTIDDFEGRARAWTADGGVPGALRAVRDPGGAPGHVLAITLTRQTAAMVRATWQVDVSDLGLSPQSRVRFRLYGSRLARRPHGGLVVVESGGAPNGADSHWLAPIDEGLYGGEAWQQVEMPPLEAFHPAGWSSDSDGRLDPSRIARLLFVAQQEASVGETRPYTVYVDDIQVSMARPTAARTVAATQAPPATAPRPRLRGFVGRARAHPPQITFRNLTGWSLEVHGSATAALVRTDEEPLFDRYAARLAYSSMAGGWIAMRPPKPIRLPARWNAVQLWVFGNNWDWMPDPTTPQPQIAICVADRTGELHRLDLGRVNWKFWGLLHKLVLPDPAGDAGHNWWGGDLNGRIDGPAHFVALEVRGVGAPAERRLYFDSVAFYAERPPRLALPANQLRLPFPTKANGIVPPASNPLRSALHRVGAGWRFSISGQSRAVTYEYVPRTGTLSDLSVMIGGRRFTPAADAGPLWQPSAELLGPGDPRVRRRLLSAAAIGGVLRTRWRWDLGASSIEYGLSLRVVGPSLVHEWTSDARSVTGLSLGRAAGLRAGRLLRVPYYSVMGPGGAGVMMDGEAFESHLFDWYVTGCSAFTGGAAEISPAEVACAGSAEYRPLTNGMRNPLRERCVLTVSSRFEETLPTIPNPPSPNTAVLRRYMYTHLGGTAPGRFDGWLAALREYARYGVDRLIVTQHEDSWTEGGDVGQGPQEYTMTAEAPPDVPGGEGAMRRYYAAVRKLGHFVGPYNNYTDYSPLGKSWDERNVTRAPDGEWRRAWPPTFNIRPPVAAAMARRFGPIQAARYGVNATYCDVHTCVAPWEYVDYQAGIPGAGMMRTTFEAYARVLLAQRAAFGGRVFSEGTHHCFYAGLVDGSYAQMALPDPPGQPLLLEFDLLRLHPLGADISMLPGADWPDDQYHCMATTIAYGHAGFFPFSEVSRSCRYYYLVGALQQRVVQTPVRDIAYWDGARYLSATAALPAGANRRGQVRVRYAGDLDVWVNCSKSERWLVRVDGRTYDLPPYGWVARGAGGFLTYSALADGRRVSYVRSPELLFADPGARRHDFGEISTDGMVAVKTGPRGARTLFTITPCGSVRVGGRTFVTRGDSVRYDIGSVPGRRTAPATSDP